MHHIAAGILKRIRLSAHKKLDTLYAGKYRSAFKGNGILFESLREYAYGDEIKSIDWNVSARTGKLHVREYIEERELSIVLALDMSSSMSFGSTRIKRDALLEFAAIILQLAETNSDAVSLALFTDSIELFTRPKKGPGCAIRALDRIIAHTPGSSGTDVSAAADFLARILKKRSIVFLVSDFLDAPADKSLKLLSRRHDLIPVRITDVAERGLSYSGIIECIDSETGAAVAADGLDGIPQMADSGYLDISLPGDVLDCTLEYFERRRRRKRTRW